MTGRTQNTARARTRRLIVATVAAAILGTALTAGEAVAGRGQETTRGHADATTLAAWPQARSQAAATHLATAEQPRALLTAAALDGKVAAVKHLTKTACAAHVPCPFAKSSLWP